MDILLADLLLDMAFLHLFNVAISKAKTENHVYKKKKGEKKKSHSLIHIIPSSSMRVLVVLNICTSLLLPCDVCVV